MDPAPPRGFASRGLAAGRSTRNAGRIAGTPKLIRRPRHPWTGISHFHLGAATLAADLKVRFAHPGDSSAL